MKTFLFLLTALTFILSCQKINLFDKYTVQGKLFEEITKKPLKGVNMHVEGVKPLLFGATRDILGSTSTNEDGSFSIKVKKNSKFTRYELFFPYSFTENYFDISSVDIYNDDFINENFNLSDLYFTPKSTLILSYKNVTPYDEFDKLYFVVSSIKYSNKIKTTTFGSSEFDFIADGNKYIGRGVSGTETIKVAGNKYVKILKIVKKNNKEQRMVDSVFCKKGEIQKFDLFY